MTGADSNDTRFQFEVIKELAASVREQSSVLTEVLVRLARIEEQRVHEAVATLEARVNKLEADKDRREGATGAFHWILKWGPTLFGLFTVVFLVARALGVLHLPDAAVPASPPAIERRADQ